MPGRGCVFVVVAVVVLMLLLLELTDVAVWLTVGVELPAVDDNVLLAVLDAVPDVR
jgi:hypothetical protein